MIDDVIAVSATYLSSLAATVGAIVATGWLRWVFVGVLFVAVFFTLSGIASMYRQGFWEGEVEARRQLYFVMNHRPDEGDE